MDVFDCISEWYNTFGSVFLLLPFESIGLNKSNKSLILLFDTAWRPLWWLFGAFHFQRLFNRNEKNFSNIKWLLCIYFRQKSICVDILWDWYHFIIGPLLLVIAMALVTFTMIGRHIYFCAFISINIAFTLLHIYRIFVLLWSAAVRPVCSNLTIIKLRKTRSFKLHQQEIAIIINQNDSINKRDAKSFQKKCSLWTWFSTLFLLVISIRK